MYRCHGWTPALLLTVLFAMQSTLCNAEPPKIGVAASIRPNAEGVIGANSRTLSSGSELYANETVRTGNVGRANLMFIDNTNLTVGPTSEVLLDEFVYDPIGSSGRVVMQATRGAFRFDTGKQDHSAYQLKTPYGTAAPAQSHGPDKGTGNGCCTHMRRPISAALQTTPSRRRLAVVPAQSLALRSETQKNQKNEGSAT